jgi:hypothetical protein
MFLFSVSVIISTTFEYINKYKAATAIIVNINLLRQLRWKIKFFLPLYGNKKAIFFVVNEHKQKLIIPQ